MKVRVFAVLLSMAYIFAGSIASGQDQKLTGDQIINKHLEAVGGKEAMARFKTRVALGTGRKENEPEGRLAGMSGATGGRSLFFGLCGYELRLGYDGTCAFIRPAIAPPD